MTKRKKELKKIRKAKLKKIKQMKKTLKEFFSFANSFGQVGGLGQDHVFVGFSHGDLMELKYSEEEYFTPKKYSGSILLPGRKYVCLVYPGKHRVPKRVVSL